MNLESLFAFKLSFGDHESPEDGVCFMEAVAWMQGEEHSDRPECACPVLGAYGIKLNDNMGDKYRPLLNPLILKMAGTRDESKEQERSEYLLRQTVIRIVCPTLQTNGVDADPLRQAAKSGSLEDIESAACAAASAAAWAAARAASATDSAAAWAAGSAARAAAWAARAAESEGVWKEAVLILNEAIDLGPHGGDFYPIHETRLETFKREILQDA